MAELKPCPFCGRIPKIEECEHWGYFIICECGIEQSELYKQKCDAVKHWNKRKTEPTTEDCSMVEPQLTAKCLNCANSGSYKCSKCDGEMYFKDEPQTVRSNLEPFRVDEPQTEIHGLTDCDFCKGKNCEDCEGGKDEPQTEMTTEQIVNELLSIKKILDDGKMPKQRCGNCKHLTYRWNKTWCDIKCDNPHDMVCDKWERSE